MYWCGNSLYLWLWFLYKCHIQRIKEWLLASFFFSSQFLSLSFVGELVGNRGSKMPYAKIQQLGISFNNLPLDLKKEIGVIPRKPSLYGSGQRRKLWLARHDWSFGISLPVPSMDSCTTPSATTHTSTSPTPTPSLVNSSTSC